ncbi:MAG: hypothetical protein WB424_17240 [Terracidiphilus sp.]
MARFTMLSAAFLLSGTALTFAQTKTSVQIDLSKEKALVYSTSIGVGADRWDNAAYSPEALKNLQDAGFTLLGYPVGEGIDALYHWSTGKLVNPYKDDRLPAFADQSKFPAVVPAIDQMGTALVAVNYGTNLDGTGGGEPAEAAAWVAYANGKADNTQVIGKDSKGNDWKTVGFWAGLRGSAPLATDDGYNHLRIGHPDPLGIMLWTIGQGPSNNGFYGQERTPGSDADRSGKYGEDGSMEPDLHAGQPNNSKDWGRFESNSKMGPQTYGAAVVAFAKAMKAVDPTILVGAYVTQPPTGNNPHPYGAKWNETVLKAACSSMDFSAYGFGLGYGAAPDFNQWIDEDDLLLHNRYLGDINNHSQTKNDLEYNYATLAGDLQDKYKKYCPAGHFPPLAITGIGTDSWLPAQNPTAMGIFAADSTAELLELGVYTVIWYPEHNPKGAKYTAIMDSQGKTGPIFEGLRLLHTAASPGDTFVQADSETREMAIHSVKRRDGGLGLVFLNKNQEHATTVSVKIAGYNFASKGVRYDWNKESVSTGKGVIQAPIDNLGANFTIDVPRYGITVVVIPGK